MRAIYVENVSISINGTFFTHVGILMGCAPSTPNKRQKLKVNDSNAMDAYIKVEREIWQEEQQAPAPALTHTIAKLEKITSDLEKLTTDINQNLENVLSLTSMNMADNLDSRSLEDIDNSINSVMTELRVTNNVKLAAEHEEFIANLNRKALKYRQINHFNRKKVELEEEAAKLSDRVQNLQKLYEHQDTILSEILGATYSSRTESELDRLRNYRDALYSGELAWQDAIKLTQSASVFAQAGCNSWQTIHITSNVEPRFQLATETRNAIHEAALSVQSAQSMLPTVQFPYCTHREIFAILQVIEYLYSDMQIPERYNHAKEVYKSFHKRTVALCDWLKELMNTTIHKDVSEVDDKITELVGKLSAERISMIKKKVPVRTLANGILAAESIESLSDNQRSYLRN